MTTTMRDEFNDVMRGTLDVDPRVALVLAEISADAFVDAAERHPDRVINTGIREQLMIGVAGGLALTGMRPVAHTYAPFLVERPFEQIKLDLGHQDVGAVLVSIGASYDRSVSGRTHQAPADVALLDTLPGWTVYVPGHAGEVGPLLRQAISGEDRVYLRLSTQANAAAREVDPGRFEVVRRGSAGTVLAVGPMLDRTLEAVAGLDVTVLYATTVRPFDGRTLLATLGAPVVVLVEPYREGTSVPFVAAALRHLPHRSIGIGVPAVELRHYGSPAEHDTAYGLDAASLRRRIQTVLAAQPAI
ncbi:MAG: transketolase family protein [Jatrophihabitans sp.]